MDLLAGVAAHEPVHGEGADRARKGGPFDGQRADRPGGPGAADGEDLLLLGVHVQHILGRKIRRVEAPGAQHAHLLVHGEQTFQGPVGDIVPIQNGQGHGYGDAVVAAQGGAPGAHGVPVYEEVQPLLLHVLGAVRVLFGHHVHVALDHDRGGMLIARRGGLPDDDVVELVLTELQVPLFGEGHQIVADRLGVVGPVGMAHSSSKK